MEKGVPQVPERGGLQCELMEWCATAGESYSADPATRRRPRGECTLLLYTRACVRGHTCAPTHTLLDSLCAMNLLGLGLVSSVLHAVAVVWHYLSPWGVVAVERPRAEKATEADTAPSLLQELRLFRRRDAE